MTKERLQQRCDVRKRLNEVYRLKSSAINAGLDTTALDNEIDELIAELRRKEGQRWV